MRTFEFVGPVEPAERPSSSVILMKIGRLVAPKGPVGALSSCFMAIEIADLVVPLGSAEAY